MSIRALCAANEIPTWSTVNARANREGWDALRTEYQRQVEAKSLDLTASKRAQKIAEIQLDALNVIHAAILKMAEDMDAYEEWEDSHGVVHRRKLMRMTPKDLDIMLARFQTFMGQPTQINESRNLGIDILSEADPEAMRQILAALRPERTVGLGPGPAEVAHPEKARAN